MKIKTVTWNIGGGKLLEIGADPSLMASYSIDGIEEIVKWLKDENPDIITLQETQKNTHSDQVSIIARKLGYKYFIHDSTSESHVDEGYQLGHCIISRHPLEDHKSGFFFNPKVEVEWEDGSTATSFDKGYSTCSTTINGVPLTITTLHLIPFRRFNIELSSDLGRSILANVTDTLRTEVKNLILQGDFNINDATLEQHLPELFKDGMNEISLQEATTPKGNRYDHILFRGITLNNTRVDRTVLTDHYPVIAEFEVS